MNKDKDSSFAATFVKTSADAEAMADRSAAKQASRDRQKECCMGKDEDCMCEKEFKLEAMESCCGGACCATRAE